MKKADKLNLTKQDYFLLCVFVSWCFTKDFFTTLWVRHLANPSLHVKGEAKRFISSSVKKLHPAFGNPLFGKERGIMNNHANLTLLLLIRNQEKKTFSLLEIFYHASISRVF
ncbi:MAG: hypothetical protein C6Y22_25585 [Hapalosiphonaceae cyanobacterium JJU2]|nr:MAG: hypothetical protein C6Y22_25585 [Hapalosiphonaceae cyanobacterium JJU2]